MPKAGGGQLEDPKSRAGSCPEQLSSLSTFCQGTAWPRAPRGPERSRCQPPPPPLPGTCPTSLITDSQQAVRSLIERPWGEGAAETVKYPEGDTAIPSQSRTWQLPSHPLMPAWGVPGGRRNHWQPLIKSHPPVSTLTITALSIHCHLRLFKSQAVSSPC